MLEEFCEAGIRPRLVCPDRQRYLNGFDCDWLDLYCFRFRWRIILCWTLFHCWLLFWTFISRLRPLYSDLDNGHTIG